MPDSLPQRPSFSSGRKWKGRFNASLSSLALLALVGMANYLAVRHYVRLQWALHPRFELSPLTRHLLRNVTNNVNVIIYYNKDDAFSLYSSVEGLLKEYQLACPHISIQVVDYTRDISDAERIKARYHLHQADKNLVIFACNHRFKVVYESQLSVYDYNLQGLLTGKDTEVKRKGFKGEMLFTSAILSVTSAKQPKVYWLTGHGEGNPSNEDRTGGYSEFADLLRQDNVKLQSLTLFGTNNVPADCQLLIITGPHDAPFHPAELEKIDDYLNQGGRLFLLMNYRSARQKLGLTKIMAKWGVKLGHDMVLDLNPKNTWSGDDLIINQFASHPVVNPLAQSALYMILPRSVKKLSSALTDPDAPTVTELAFTSLDGVSVTDIRQGVPYLDRHTAKRGSIPVMAAVEKGSIQGVSEGLGATRIIVVGDSLMLNNQFINNYMNRDFAMLAVNWLLDRSHLLGGIGPRPVNEYRIELSKADIHYLEWILLAGFPGGVLLLGYFVWLKRRV